MELIEIIVSVGGGFIVLLLSIVAYFLKNLHSQLQTMDKDFKEVITKLAVMDERTKNNHEEQNGRFRQIEHRLTQLENWRNK